MDLTDSVELDLGSMRHSHRARLVQIHLDFCDETVFRSILHTNTHSSARGSISVILTTISISETVDDLPSYRLGTEENEALEEAQHERQYREKLLLPADIQLKP